MASAIVDTGVSLLDDPKHLKSFFSKAKNAPIKSYRVGANASSEVAASDREPSESGLNESHALADTNGAASPVLSAALEAGDVNNEGFTADTLETDEATNACDFSGTATMNLATHNAQSAWIDASANSGVHSLKTVSSSLIDRDIIPSYGHGPTSFDMAPAASVNNDAHTANPIDDSSYEKHSYGFDDTFANTSATQIKNSAHEASLENSHSNWMQSDKVSNGEKTVRAEAQTYVLQFPQMNSDGSVSRPADSVAAVADIDSPVHRKSFFESVRAKGNTFGSRYVPRAAREIEEASQMEEEGHGEQTNQEEEADGDISASENNVHEHSEPQVAALQEIEEFSNTHHGRHETVLHPGNGVSPSSFFGSPRVSGVVAPPPTPETPARVDKEINVPATIMEQSSSPSEISGGKFTLSQSIHAPPHLRSSSTVQKKPVPAENYGSFERQSFKAVDGEMPNGVTAKEAKTEKADDGTPKDPGIVKSLPPHLRSRPTNISGIGTSTNMNKPVTNSESVESTPIAAKFNGNDPKILSMRHAKARAPIDTQRFMDLGIHAHEQKASKENNSPTAKAVPDITKATPKVVENLAPTSSTAYRPPHMRAGASEQKTTVPFRSMENTITINSHATDEANGAVDTNDGAKGVSNNNDLILGTTWGKPLPRDGGPARHRKVILKGLPEYSTPAFAACLVWGGPIEEIVVAGTNAYITFMHAGDCDAYYKVTSNDVKYTANGQQCYVTVSLDNDVNPPSGGLKTAIEKEFTRSVRLIGVEGNYKLEHIWAMASHKGRKIESIEDGKTARGARQILVNFCNVYDAIKFRSELNRDEDWEHINMGYHSDPCAEATGVRTLNSGPNFMIKRPMAQAF